MRKQRDPSWRRERPSCPAKMTRKFYTSLPLLPLRLPQINQMMFPLRSQDSRLTPALGRTKIKTGAVAPLAQDENKVVSGEKRGRAPHHLALESFTSSDSDFLFDLP